MRAMRFYSVTARLSIATALLFMLTTSAQADLIAHYPFDGDSSDASGNGNDGFDDGDAGPAGPFTGFDGVGQAYEFFGQGHVVIPLDINPNEYPQLTVTMWVRPDEFIVDAPGLYKTFGHDDGGWDRTFGLDNRQGEYRYAAFTGGAGPGPTAATATEVTEDWTFLAAVWDSDAGPTVRFHANDDFIEEPLNNTPSVHSESAIGNLRPDNFAEGWQGLIDEVQIYDQALSVDQVNNVRILGEPDPAVTLTAILNEDQEPQDTQGVPNSAAGTATVTYTKETGILDWDIQWTDLSGPATAMHLHGPAAVGDMANVQVDIGGNSGLTSPSVGMEPITSAQADELAAGLWYVNVHTAANGVGEIRGQLQPLKPAIWEGGDAGLWEDRNWSNAPSNNTNVSINPSGSASVQGPLADSLVYSVSLGSSGDGIGELRLRPGVSFSAIGGTTVGAQGRLVGAGTLVGPLTIESQGELVVLSGETFLARGTIRPLEGVVTSMGNTTFERSVTNTMGGVINGTSTTLTFPGNGVKDDIGLENQGTLNLTRAVVNGDVHSPSGSTINVGVDVTFNGLVSGAADFPGAGSVTFSGGFDPGDSPAKMLFGGDVTFGEANTLRIELGGLVPGEQYDQLNVLGDVDFKGTLLVELLGDFQPSAGDEFVLMNYGDRGNSWFEEIVLPAGQWHLHASDQQMTLLAVPEPSGLMVIFTSLPLLGWLRRRKAVSIQATASIGSVAMVRSRLLLLTTMCLVTASTLKADLIAYYPFDQDSTDQSGNGNDGFDDGDAQPAGPFTGLVDGAYEFAGQGHVVIPLDINSLEYPELTVTMWVKPDESIVESPGLYKTFGHDDGGWDRTFGLDNRNGPYRYAAFTGGAGPGPTATTGTTITSDWTFLASVWSFDDGTVTFYANGNSVEEPLNDTPSAHFESAIGNLRPDNFAEGWVGLIDEVEIHDRALTPTQVNEIFTKHLSPEWDFINPEGGLWDVSDNWTGVGIPGSNSQVTINPDSSIVVIGPSSDTSVQWVKLGGKSGIAELRLTGDRSFSTGTAEGFEVGDKGRLIANGKIGGAFNVNAGGELVVMSGESLQIVDQPGPNAGTIQVMGTLTLDESMTNSATGRVNAVGGTLNFPGNAAVDEVGLTNQGQLDLTDSIVNGDVQSPAGTTINVVKSADFNGLVSGGANFPGAGEVRFNGGYQPGDSAALVQFSGDVSFGTNNSLLMEIGGLQAGIEHDKLEIAGDVSLGGELRVELIDGFSPVEGNQFTLMTYNSRNDTVFDSVVFPSAAWSITYGNQALLVSVGDAALPGDYNSDGVVDAADINLQAEAMKDPNPDLTTFDENGDNLVDIQDRQIWVKDHAKTWMGDANLDNEFNSGDLVTVFAAGLYETGQMALWEQGDWDGDMTFGSGDLVLAFADGGYEQGPPAIPAVPEPSSIWLVWIGVAALVHRRW